MFVTVAPKRPSLALVRVVPSSGPAPLGARSGRVVDGRIRPLYAPAMAANGLGMKLAVRTRPSRNMNVIDCFSLADSAMPICALVAPVIVQPVNKPPAKDGEVTGGFGV